MEATEFLISPPFPPIIHGLKAVVFLAEVIKKCFDDNGSEFLDLMQYSRFA
jgi:hypothetical protein